MIWTGDPLKAPCRRHIMAPGMSPFGRGRLRHSYSILTALSGIYFGGINGAEGHPLPGGWLWESAQNRLVLYRVGLRVERVQSFIGVAPPIKVQGWTCFCKDPNLYRALQHPCRAPFVQPVKNNGSQNLGTRLFTPWFWLRLLTGFKPLSIMATYTARPLHHHLFQNSKPLATPLQTVIAVAAAANSDLTSDLFDGIRRNKVNFFLVETILPHERTCSSLTVGAWLEQPMQRNTDNHGGRKFHGLTKPIFSTCQFEHGQDQLKTHPPSNMYKY